MLPPFAAMGLALVALVPTDVPRPILVTNVRLSTATDAKPASILVRDGRIVRVEESAIEAPPDARTIDGKGALALAAFLDAYSFTGCTTPEPKAERDSPAKTSTDVLVDMREANRKGIQPAFRAADVFDAGAALEDWRKAGFGALLSAPSGQLLSGQSALVVTRTAAARDAIVRASVFDHASFRASGPGYPGTLMGSIAQLRQFFLDAARHGVLTSRRAAGKPGERVPFDADLDAALAIVADHRRVCAAVDEADDIERFAKLADEHAFELAIAGGREAWKRAELLAKRDAPVILVLPGGDEPEDPDAKGGKDVKDGKDRKDAKDANASKDATDSKDVPGAKDAKDDKDAKDPKKKNEPSAEDAPWTYTEPVAVLREKRRLWSEEQSGARVLSEAGVRIAFGTGKDKPKDLLERVRKLVKAGLPRETALKALTDGAADVLGAAPALGRLAVGCDASFALWTKDPLVEKDAAVAWMFVDGRAHEFDVDDEKKGGDSEKPDDGVDATGTWSITYEAPQVPSGELEIRMQKDGSVEGTLRGKSPDGAPVEAAMTGKVTAKKLKVSGTLEVGDFRAELVLEGEMDGNSWSGSLTGVLPNGVGFSAQRTPKEEAR